MQKRYGIIAVGILVMFFVVTFIYGIYVQEDKHSNWNGTYLVNNNTSVDTYDSYFNEKA